MPDWMMSFAHSLQGKRATYMRPPATDAEFLFFKTHTHTKPHTKVGSKPMDELVLETNEWTS